MRESSCSWSSAGKGDLPALDPQRWLGSEENLVFQQMESEQGDVFGWCGDGGSCLQERQGKPRYVQFSNPCIFPSIKSNIFTWGRWKCLSFDYSLLIPE